MNLTNFCVAFSAICYISCAVWTGTFTYAFILASSQKLETEKEIRNELQMLNKNLVERIECIPLVFEKSAELKVGKGHE